MKKSIDEVVRGAVSHYLGVDAKEVRPADHFERDLALEVLDVVLIAFHLEEHQKLMLPIDQLQSVETVGQLTALVRTARASGAGVGSHSSTTLRKRQPPSLRWQRRD
jgi:acyl carrier protein